MKMENKRTVQKTSESKRCLKNKIDEPLAVLYEERKPIFMESVTISL